GQAVGGSGGSPLLSVTCLPRSITVPSWVCGRSERGGGGKSHDAGGERLYILHRPPRSLLGSPANTQLPDWAQESIDLLPPSCPLRILITVPRLGSLNAIPAPDLCMFSLCH
uniref:Uncharacterized protein n=1 Tax=Bos indicus x Bos taurus TaxID=30522 RepID=A0A4W2BS45_BOBOX